MEMFLLLALLAISSTSTTATPLGDTAPLCSVIMTYDEINSASPHWTASFQIKTRQPLQPGAIVDIQLAGNNTSSSPIPTIVGIKINGDNICSTEKVLTTISTYSSKSALDPNSTIPITTTTTTTTTTDRSLGRNNTVIMTTTEKYVDMKKTTIVTTTEGSAETDQTMQTDTTTTETSQTNPTTPQSQLDT